MTYETYCEMTDVLQESINDGSITLEAADDLNNIFYESYINEAHRDDEQHLENIIKELNNDFREDCRDIRKAIRDENISEAKSLIDDAKQRLDHIERSLNDMPEDREVVGARKRKGAIIGLCAGAIITGLFYLSKLYDANVKIGAVNKLQMNKEDSEYMKSKVIQGAAIGALIGAVIKKYKNKNFNPSKEYVKTLLSDARKVLDKLKSSLK